MKKQNFLMLLLVVLAFVSSCKKDNNNEISNVNGFWSGAYSFGAAAPNLKMSVLFRNNGTVRVLYGYNGTDTTAAIFKMEGTYTLQNSVLSFSYKEGSSTFIHKATLTAGNSQSGTWGTAPSDSDGGLYSLVLQ